jgi:hypothetical protein
VGAVIRGRDTLELVDMGTGDVEGDHGPFTVVMATLSYHLRLYVDDADLPMN